jgi:outer membrane receptor protein involved in Fe transport
VIPIVKGLEVDVAVRHDHYSDFGGTTNPKVTLRWQPNKSILVRGSYGKGFLAPSLQQLFLPQREGVTAPGTSDPLRCPVTNDNRDCLTQFTTTFGGNPDPRAREVGIVDRGLRVRADPGRHAGRRLVQHHREEPDRRRSADRDDPR